ncbi:zinc finger protein 664 isoform X2 [Patella vulgata]|uniref:zinc finger protein 664 isoform X2 n=1 Tax=Patella vulgata TaxID=6465 RepID=UPI00217FDD5E|nr:zinc finger protein 664 isoform X2 [Patella vulgata]
MVACCCAPGCSNFKISAQIGIPFHTFPADPEIRRRWLVNIRNKKLPVHTTAKKLKSHHVCGKHFKPSDYEEDMKYKISPHLYKKKNALRKTAVPTQFFFPEVIKSTKTKSSTATSTVARQSAYQSAHSYDYARSAYLKRENIRNGIRPVEKSDVELETNDVKTFHQCVVCNEIFQQYSILEVHRKIHVKEKKTDDVENQNKGLVKEEKTDDVTNVYSCWMCEETFERNTDLEEHCKIHVKIERPDDVDFDNDCPVHFEEAMTEVQERLSDVEARHECKLCNAVFKQYTNLEEHCKIHVKQEESSSHQCTICKISFTQYLDLEEHTCGNSIDFMHANLSSKTTDKTGNPHQCDVCSESFNCITSFRTHARTHAIKKHHECDVCSKVFAQKNGLKIHLRIHYGQKPYQCAVCSKTFTQKSQLNVHTRIHTGLKPYKCDVCDKSFITNSGLKTHRRTHNGEKTYDCDVCGKSFTNSRSVNGHKRIHSKEKTFYF